MNFQFYCPQGHLLQSDTANAGATIACPICGTQFIVPPPPQSVLDAEKKAKGQTDDDEDDTEDEDEDEELFNFGSSSKKSKKQSFDFSDLGDDDDDDDEDEYDDEDEDDTDEEYDEDEDEEGDEDDEEDGGFSFDMKNQQAASDLPPLHIPCPNGHVLEVSRDLLGEEAECPHCGEIFTLKRDNSLESINERYKKETKETTKISKQWFTFAIIVLVMFLGFIAYLMFN